MYIGEFIQNTFRILNESRYSFKNFSANSIEELDLIKIPSHFLSNPHDLNALNALNVQLREELKKELWSSHDLAIRTYSNIDRVVNENDIPRANERKVIISFLVCKTIEKDILKQFQNEEHYFKPQILEFCKKAFPKIDLNQNFRSILEKTLEHVISNQEKKININNIVSNKKHCKISGFFPKRNEKYFKRNITVNKFESSKSINSILMDKMQFLLTGSNGIGKSQLICDYCNRNRRDFEKIYWIRATNEWTLYNDFRMILLKNEVIGINGKWGYGVLLDNLEHYFGMTKNTLFVFDDIEKLEKLNSFLPNDTSNSFIMTTTNNISDSIPLQRFDNDEATNFILSHLDCYSDKDKKVAHKIARILNFFPLALEQASSFIKNTGYSLDKYVELLITVKEEIEEKYTVFRQSSITEKNVLEDEIAVALTYKIFLDNLDNDAIHDLLNICSFLSPCAIPKDLFVIGRKCLPNLLKSTVINNDLFSKLVDEIISFSIFNCYLNSNTIYINSIVQEVIKFSILGKELRWINYVADVLNVNCSYQSESQDGSFLNKSLALLPHIQNIIYFWDTFSNKYIKSISTSKSKLEQIKQTDQKMNKLQSFFDELSDKIKGSNNDTIYFLNQNFERI